MAVTTRVDGVDLEVSRLWSGRPVVRAAGQELGRDAQGRYELRDRRGRVRPVKTSFDWRQFGPRLQVGDTDVLLGRPLPAWVRVGFLVMLVVGVGLGGALGGMLAIASAIGCAELLRRPDRMPSHVLLAALIPVAAVVVYVGVATLLAQR